jgi:ferredoxin-NADP reductase
MAQHKTAKLVTAQHLGVNARLLEFAVEEDLGFTGGQYVIVNTGIPIADGKTAKRAYSILSSDAEQRRFEIAVRQIGEGPGSCYMHELAVGSEIVFSGPWGKYLPPDSSASVSPAAVERAAQPTAVIATDTGITAAMGLLSSTKFTPYRERTALTWICESDNYFLPESFVRDRISQFRGTFDVIHVSTEANRRENWLQANKNAMVGRIREQKPQTLFLSGDGLILAELRDAVLEKTPEVEIRTESFFHHEELKSLKRATVT